MTTIFPFIFSNPWYLAALPAAPLYYCFVRGGWTGVCQSLLLATLILSAADPVLRLPDGKKSAILLIDRSASASIEKNPDSLIREAIEAADLERSNLPFKTLFFEGSPSSALRRAGAGILRKGGGEIHLFSRLKGETDALRLESERLARREIPVRIHLPDEVPQTSFPDGSSALLEKLEYPLSGGTGETLPLKISLISSGENGIHLALRSENGRTLSELSTSARTGRNEYTLFLPLKHAPGLLKTDLLINGKKTASCTVKVLPPAPALLYSSAPGTDKARIEALLGPSAKVEIAGETDDPSLYSLLIFCEGAGKALSSQSLLKIAEAVRKGSGMLVFAGKETPFDLENTPEEFEELLPVRYEGKTQEKSPTASLVIIIDSSGSMSGTRINIAREVARLALDSLRDCDMAGIVEFHGRRRWAAPLQSAANHYELRRALNRLNAGGGTVILPAIREAFLALKNSHTRLKHVLVITDGGVEYGDFETLLRQMAEENITTSCVMVGPGESAFLSQLALWGNGRFYNAAGRFALPELHFRQSGKNALPPFREGDFLLTPGSGEGGRLYFSGLPLGLKVHGILPATLKEEAQCLLSAGENDPFLAIKRNSLGFCATVHSGLDPLWNRELLNAKEYPPSFSAAARSLYDPAKAERIRAVNRSSGKMLRIRMESLEDLECLTLRFRPEGLQETAPPRNGSREEEYTLLPDGNGIFLFERPAPPPGIYELEVEGNSVPFPIAVNPEYAFSSGEEETLLAEESRRISKLIPSKTLLMEDHPLRLPLGILSGLLLLLQLAMRRFQDDRKEAPLLSLHRTIRSGKNYLLVFLFFFAGFFLFPIPPGHAGDFQSLLRRSLLLEEDGHLESAESFYAKAGKAADTPCDRRFAASLRFECARRAGKTLSEHFSLPGLPGGNAQQPPSPEEAEFLVNELERQGRNEEALNLLEQYGKDEIRTTLRLFRLAEKSSRLERFSRMMEQAQKEMQNPSPGAHSPETEHLRNSLLHLNLAVRALLLKGERAKAEELYLQRIEKGKDNPDSLMEISRNAEAQALYSAAEKALRQIPEISPGDSWAAQSELIRLFRRRGDTGKALELLKESAEKPGLTPENLLNLADACEQAGDPDTALRIYLRSGSVEAFIRAAMLEESRGKNLRAAEFWKQVLTASGNEMQARQAMGRIISLFRKERKLPELIRETAVTAVGEKLPKDHRAFLFHLRALAAGGEKETLSTLLRKQMENSENPLEWKRLELNFLLEFKDYGAAKKLLEELILLHPEEKESSLRTLVIIALETGDRVLAENVLKEILNSAENEAPSGKKKKETREKLASAYEFAGNVHAHFKDHEAACRDYDKSLSLSPERYELYLLKAKSEQALGRGKESIAFFLQGLKQAQDPELVGIMADGLLNMNAPGDILLEAFTELKKRIDGDPGNLFFHRLAEDFAEELKLWKDLKRLRLSQLHGAPMRRALILRTLFEEALLEGKEEEALHFAHLLTDLDEILSPELYLSLGEVLIRNGSFIHAEECLRNAADLSGDRTLILTLADAYESAGRFRDAERICSEALLLEKDNPELLARSASAAELRRNFLKAAEQNLKALKIRISRLVSPPPFPNAGLTGKTIEKTMEKTTEKTAGKITAEQESHGIQKPQSRRGSSQSRAISTLEPLQRAFCNQAVLFPERFLPEIQSLEQEAGHSPLQKEQWSAIRKRIEFLLHPEPPPKPKPLPDSGTRKKRNLPAGEKRKTAGKTASDPRAVASEFTTRPAAERAEYLSGIFSEIKAERLPDFWIRLIGFLKQDPGKEAEQFLRRQGEMLFPGKTPVAVLHRTAALWMENDAAADLKLFFAGKWMLQHPESSFFPVLTAHLKHRNGNPGSARLLAADFFCSLAENQEGSMDLMKFNLMEIDRLRGLNRIYAASGSEESGEAGRRARRELIKSLENDNLILGSSPRRLLLLAILQEGAGEYDKALDSLVRMWEMKPSAFPMYRLMHDVARKSGRWETYLETLLNHKAPEDPSGRILHAMRLVPLLRESGRFREARKYLGYLSPVWKERESFLAAMAQGNGSSPMLLRDSLFRFLLRQRQQAAGSFGIQNFQQSTLGGILGHKEEEEKSFRFSRELLVGILCRIPGAEEDAEYLLRGISPGEYRYSVLFRAFSRAAVKSKKKVPDGMSMALLSAWIRDPELPLENGFAFLEALPPRMRGEGAEMLLQNLFSREKGGIRRFEVPFLEKLFESLVPEARKKSAEKFLECRDRDDENSDLPDNREEDFELARLILLRRYDPEGCQTALKRLSPSEKEISLHLLYGKGLSTEERFRRCFRSVPFRQPDWKRIFQLLPEEQYESFTRALESEMENAFAAGFLPEDELVRQYALLSVCVPSERGRIRFLDLAKRHHVKMGEATLWIIDALPENDPERLHLLRLLQSERRLPPARRLQNQAADGKRNRMTGGIIPDLSSGSKQSPSLRTLHPNKNTP